MAKYNITHTFDSHTGQITVTKSACIQVYKTPTDKSNAGKFLGGYGIRGINCITNTDGCPSGEAILFMASQQGQRYVPAYTRLIQSVNDQMQVCEWSRGDVSHRLDVSIPVTTKIGLAKIAQIDPDSQCISWLSRYGFLRRIGKIWTVSPLYSMTNVRIYTYDYVITWLDQFQAVCKGVKLEALTAFVSYAQTKDRKPIDTHDDFNTQLTPAEMSIGFWDICLDNRHEYYGPGYWTHPSKQPFSGDTYVYAGTTPRHLKGDTSSWTMKAYVIDLDVHKGTSEDRQQALKLIHDVVLPSLPTPTATVYTGGGYQAWYRFDSDVDRLHYENLAAKILTLVPLADKATKDANRVWRCPDTYNTHHGAPIKTQVIQFSAEKYSAEILLDRFENTQEAISSACRQTVATCPCLREEQASIPTRTGKKMISTPRKTVTPVPEKVVTQRMHDIAAGTFSTFCIPTDTRWLGHTTDFFSNCKMINLPQFLGLPYSANEHFRCILPDHPDNNPSAWIAHNSIYNGNRENGWRYHCSCTSQGYDLLDIITLLRAGRSKINDPNERKRTIQYIKHAMNWKIRNYDQQ